ncbi:MAG: HipA domain-containing protein, partial [Oligoflexia bacterium]|nr:HipA domain-containing protein [Oligoflexia bacterium]
MGRKSSQNVLDVYMSSHLVGKLSKDVHGEISFSYSKDWSLKGMPISLSLPLHQESFKGDKVSSFFENLLPDNQRIRSLIASKYSAVSTKAFDLLSVIGRDCIGALSFFPDGTRPDIGGPDTYRILSKVEIEKKLKGLGSTSPLGMDQGEFRISLAGAQEKMALLKVNNRYAEPQKMTATTHIFKMPIGALGDGTNFHDSIDNEWISLQICKRLGLNVAEATIEIFGNTRSLVITRFDRLKEGTKTLRLPQEDFCQALGVSPYRKYENEGGPGIVTCSKLIRTTLDPSKDLSHFFKSLLVFDLLLAPDGHAKNFSIFLTPYGVSLTPLYDVLSGHFLIRREGKRENEMKLAMAVGNSRYYTHRKIKLRHYQECAKKSGLPDSTLQAIIEELVASL